VTGSCVTVTTALAGSFGAATGSTTDYCISVTISAVGSCVSAVAGSCVITIAGSCVSATE
jgi:hypothetical protein